MKETATRQQSAVSWGCNQLKSSEISSHPHLPVPLLLLARSIFLSHTLFCVHLGPRVRTENSVRAEAEISSTSNKHWASGWIYNQQSRHRYLPHGSSFSSILQTRSAWITFFFFNSSAFNDKIQEIPTNVSHFLVFNDECFSLWRNKIFFFLPNSLKMLTYVSRSSVIHFPMTFGWALGP